MNVSFIVINNKNITTLTQNNSKLKAFEEKNGGMMKNDDKKKITLNFNPRLILLYFFTL
jgi:hypothetical protein